MRFNTSGWHHITQLQTVLLKDLFGQWRKLSRLHKVMDRSTGISSLATIQKPHAVIKVFPVSAMFNSVPGWTCLNPREQNEWGILNSTHKWRAEITVVSEQEKEFLSTSTVYKRFTFKTIHGRWLNEPWDHLCYLSFLWTNSGFLLSSHLNHTCSFQKDNDWSQPLVIRAQTNSLNPGQTDPERNEMWTRTSELVNGKSTPDSRSVFTRDITN